MSEEARQTVARILSGQVIASLGTLHSGEPAVSMVPFAWTTGGVLVIHVSRLSSHTADMLAHDEATEERTRISPVFPTPSRCCNRATFHSSRSARGASA